jgi:hypothetical protein
VRVRVCVSVRCAAYFKRSFKTGRGFSFEKKWIQCFHPNTPNVVQGEVNITMDLVSARARAIVVSCCAAALRPPAPSPARPPAR